MQDTDHLSDQSRAKIEQFASEHGTELPPIPHLTFDEARTTDEARRRIEVAGERR